MLPVQNKSIGQGGDSGGPVNTRTGGRMLTMGVYIAHAEIWPGKQSDPSARAYLHIAVDLRVYKSDFCHLLGLCIEGKSWRDSVPKLKWNSVYVAKTGNISFAHGLMNQGGVAWYYQSDDDRAPAPFPIIGALDREMMLRTCDAVRRGVNRRSQQFRGRHPWMAQLVEPDTKAVLCQAVFIWEFLAITHKKCFEDAKRSGKKPLLYVGGICRPGKANCDATEVRYNFVAWSSRSDRDLAIINIVEYTDPSTATWQAGGACFPLPKDGLAMKMSLYGYDGGNEGPTETLNYGIFDIDQCGRGKKLVDRMKARQFCLTPDPHKTSEQFYDITKADTGGGAIDISKGIVCGLVAEREQDGTFGGRIIVADIRAHLDDICFYTNRCDHRDPEGGHTLTDITLFDQLFGEWSPPKSVTKNDRKIHRRKKNRKVHHRRHRV